MVRVLSSPEKNSPSPPPAFSRSFSAAVGCGSPREAGEPLPRLKKHNSTRAAASRTSFVAKENLRLYIENTGEERVGVLTVTFLPDPDRPALGLSAREFQRRWNSFLGHVVRKLFPTGQWVRERQKNGNWHAHCLVDVGFDCQTGFPFAEVEKRRYGAVDARMRALWKTLREAAPRYGIGRTELLPIRTRGEACATYLVKYLEKARSTQKLEGEEKCRLFGVWGGRRFLSGAFSKASSRIVRKRKAWLASELGVSDLQGFKTLLGEHWWHYCRVALMSVCMPKAFYKVRGADGVLGFDALGDFAYGRNLSEIPEDDIEDGITASHFNLWRAVGLCLHRGDEGKATAFALSRVAASDLSVQKREAAALGFAMASFSRSVQAG